MATEPTFVLVHGAWHGAWCWDPVVALLEEAGREVRAVELPFAGPDADVAEVVSTLDGIDGPKLLAGHSYGGQVISEAASGRSDVTRLVYVCAFAPEPDEDLATLMASAPPVPLADANRFEGDSLVLDVDRAVECFYHRSPPDRVKAAVTRLRDFRVLPPLSVRREPAWKTIPSTYVICGDDRAIHPELQLRMAERCTSRLILDTDHSPFLSTPEDLARILLAAAK